jgi:hypothetical protein
MSVTMWRTPDKLLTYFLRGEFRYLSPFAELKRDHFCCHSPSRPFFRQKFNFQFFSKTREKKQKSCDFFHWQNVFFAPLKWSQTQLCFKMKYYHRFLYLCVYGEKCLKNPPRVSTFFLTEASAIFFVNAREFVLFLTVNNKIISHAIIKWEWWTIESPRTEWTFFLSTTIYIESLILNFLFNCLWIPFSAKVVDLSLSFLYFLVEG